MILLANYYAEGAAVLLGGAFVYYIVSWWKHRNDASFAATRAEDLLAQARREAETITREARLAAQEEILKLRAEAERSFAAGRKELDERAQRLNERESLINRQLETATRTEKDLAAQQETLRQKISAAESEQRELAEAKRELREQLQSVSHLNESEARSRLMREVEQLALRDANQLSRKIVEEAKAQAAEKARQIISLAIQRYAGEHTSEISTATVQLPGEDLKGRVIGREGRNIRAFEAATGVTVLIDDTPNAVVLSGFDPVRREIAREAMQQLLQDGRIHPARIEEVVKKVSLQMDETIMRLGDEAVRKAGVPPLHPEIVKVLGQLHFRRSHAQNVLSHSVEVAHLMGLMAAELGIDPEQARRAGLLHDIGKAINHEVEGAHAVIGAELIRRYGEAEPVVNGVASHHNDVPPTGPLGPLVSAADAISASRPGARAETMQIYLRRVEDLERIGCSFAGVEKCFAVQAGRELRVFVQPERITDDQAAALARNISRKIEESLQYPGQIRVTVVRETRCVDFAK